MRNKFYIAGISIYTLFTLIICIRYYPLILKDLGLRDEELPCKDKLLEFIAKETRFESKVKDLLTFSIKYTTNRIVQDEYLVASNTQQQFFSNSEILQERIENARGLCQNNKTVLAICSFQGNTAQHVQEWVSHYLLLGVSKFYIYNNFAKQMEGDNLKRVLKPFVDLGYVEIIRYSERTQISSAQDCITRATNKYDWVGFLDVDEYVTFNNEETCAPNFLSKFKEEHNDVGAIALAWRVVQVTGVPVYDPHKTLYEQARHEVLPHDSLMKLFVYVPAIIRYVSVHEPILRPNFFLYDARGQQLDAKQTFPDSYTAEEKYQVLELRHFWGLSLDFMVFDKLCGYAKERQHYLERRLETAFSPFFSNTEFEVLPMSKHQPILHEFLYANEFLSERGREE